MKKRRTLILFLVFTIAVGFMISSVSSVDAAKKTAKFKDSGFVHKNIGNGDRINLFSVGKYRDSWAFDVDISIQSLKSNNPKHKLTSAKVKFVKKVNGKNKYTTKTFKAKKDWEGKWAITNYSPNRVSKGYKPYSAVVYYTDIKKSSNSWNKFDSGIKRFSGVSFKYISQKKGNSIKTKIYSPNMMTGKINILTTTFKITKSGSKWKAVSDDMDIDNKLYSKSYSLQKAYKTYLNYNLRKLNTMMGQ